jgi:uncharacterized protein YndB with AHSA1/START domain
MRTQDPVSAVRKPVEVGLNVAAPPATVYAALTEPAQIAQWFGDLIGKLHPGGSARLDFGDGDFFAIDQIVLAPPEAVAYRWRFLGIMPLNAIRWTIRSAPSGSRVTVTDADPLRSDEDAEMLRQGWKDFTSRLGGFLSSGESTRYDWRRTFDGGTELPCSPAEAIALVTSPRLSARWLPIEGGLAQGAELVPRDGLQPAVLEVAEVDPTANGVRFFVTSPQWRGPTECSFEAQARGDGAMLTVAHGGWEGIDRSAEIQRFQRRRFAGIWIAALRKLLDAAGRASA